MAPQAGLRFQRTDIWREGKWLDLWSVVHLLSGISVGFGASLFHFTIFPTLVIALLLLVMYEMWETIARIEETIQNRILDVVVGMASFVPALLFASKLSRTEFIVAYCAILTVNIMLAVVGWSASRKASALEERMKERYEKERVRVLERRDTIREKFLLRRLRKLERERARRQLRH